MVVDVVFGIIDVLSVLPKLAVALAAQATIAISEIFIRNE